MWTGKRSKPVQNPGGTEWQTGSRSRQAEWSGRSIENEKAGAQDEPAQRDRKHRDKYTGSERQETQG